MFFLLLPFSFSVGQTLELFGKKVSFGKSLSEQKNGFWEKDGLIESIYSYIEIYEGENVTGWFYKNKLVTIDVNTWSKNVCDEIENLLSHIEPYKQFSESNDGVVNFEFYKTNEYYINRASSSKSVDYTIIPIQLLEDIRIKHPEYLSKLF